MRKFQERGITLLESAISIPVFITLTLGALDATSLFHARRALMEGSKTALRCAYPVDGNCVEMISEAPSPLYKVSLLEEENKKLYGYKYDYEGSAFSVAPPVYKLSGFTADTLKEVYYDKKEYEHRAEKLYFPAKALTPPATVLKTIYPKVTGTNEEDATFSYLNTSAGYSSLNYSISPIKGNVSNSSSSKELGSITINIPKPASLQPGVECFKSDHFNYLKGHDADYSKKCSSVAAFNRNKVNIVLYVRGKAKELLENRTGEAVVSIRLNGKELGGRKFTNSTTGRAGASLVPRGAPYKYLSGRYKEVTDPRCSQAGGVEDCKSKDIKYAELLKYTPLTVPYDTDLTLAVSLRHVSGGKVGWKGDSVSVYVPQFKQVPGRELECVGGVLKSELLNPSACVTAESVTKAYLRSSGSSPIRKGPVEVLGLSAGKSFDTQATFSSLNLQEIDYLLLPPKETGKLLSQPPLPCKANYGVTENADSLGYIKESNEAKNICSPKDPEAINLRWKEETISINVPEITWVKKSCEESSLPLAKIPSEVKKYKKHFVPAPTFSHQEESNTFFLGKDTDPREALSLNPLYSCGDFIVKEVFYNSSTPDTSETSLFRGLHFELGCDWEETLREEAIRLGMDENAFFKASQKNKTSSLLRGAPKECTEYWGDSTPGEEKLIGVFSKDNLPEICNEKTCKLQFSSYEGGELNLSPTYNLEEASKDWGLKEMRAIYPRLKTECQDGEKNCGFLKVTESLDGTEVISKAELNVPLNFLLGDTKKVSYSNVRKKESKYAE